MKTSNCRWRERLSRPAAAIAGLALIAWGGQALAALTIQEAQWDGKKLEIEGKADRDARRGTVEVFYGYDDSADPALLGTARVNGGGKWKLKVRSRRNNPLDPVPCAVSAKLADQEFLNFPVEGADPATCAPQPPGDNSPPDVTNPGTQSNSEGDTVSLQIVASDPDGDGLTFGASGLPASLDIDPNTGLVSGDIAAGAAGIYTVTVSVTDDGTPSATTDVMFDWIVNTVATGGDPTARGDTYATAVGKTLEVQLSRVSGVLYNDFDTDADGNNIGNDGLTAQLVSGPANAQSFGLNLDGSFHYTPNAVLVDNSNDSFSYQAVDTDGNPSGVATVNIHVLSDQPDFKIMMNYELGMHCTGFEFSYCCVLPPYNSIVAQVVKPQDPGNPSSNADFPRLLEGDPVNGLDGLGRETVLRDYDGSGNFQKYYIEYFHDAQPRREGNVQTPLTQDSTLISDVEGNSLLYWNTPYDSALVDTDGSITGVPGKLVRAGDLGTSYSGLTEVVVGDGDYTDATDNYANGWLNHLYIYTNEEGHPNLEGHNATAGVSLERDKIRLGVAGMVEYPANVGAALQPMGPISNGQPSKDEVGFDNVLTFSGETGTVVYTQAKVLENLPITLTSPRIWEALGLPLTPFEDSIGFFEPGGPGSVDEDAIRPFVAMKARLHTAVCDEATGACEKGPAVIGSNGQPVIGFGTAPIDIPNCERCHSAPPYGPDGSPNVNSPSYVREADGPVYGGATGMTLEAITNLEIEYWKTVYPSLTTGSDWYARLKGAAVNMLAIHDYDSGTNFLASYPASGDILGLPGSKQIPQNTRMGHESVICQKCHGDNVVAAVNPLGPDAGYFLPPISEAIHNAHRAKSAGGNIAFGDSFGRFGGCQGCHPAHRSDGVMDNYPITVDGNNANAAGDNRLGKGGCFVGRDVHSNPLKDVDGAETPAHLNAVGDWLAQNVAMDSGEWRGIWCTNCHNQLSQEIWKTENCPDLVNGDCITNPRAEPTLADVAAAVGVSLDQAEMWLDPKDPSVDPTLPGGGVRTADFTHAVWDPDWVTPDADVATVEVNAGGNCNVPPWTTSAGGVCVAVDADGDPSVRILEGFCTTEDCIAAAQATLDAEGNGSTAVAVPFSAATDGRDHWLAAGEPHCADCHAAPYVEQSGNINAFAPFNYPRKASLMRYSRGHQDITCQGCHESIHGLYPVGPAIDTTSYAQAAALNHDGSHGPLKCGTCHQVSNSDGIPTWMDSGGNNVYGITDFDSAVTWAHTYTDEANVLDSTCQNCHRDFRDEIADGEEDWFKHADVGRTSRQMMDKAEIAQFGNVWGDPAVNSDNEIRNGVCQGCHGDEWGEVACNGEDGQEWRQHLTRGRVAEVVWEHVSIVRTGSTCGW